MQNLKLRFKIWEDLISELKRLCTFCSHILLRASLQLSVFFICTYISSLSCVLHKDYSTKLLFSGSLKAEAFAEDEVEEANQEVKEEVLEEDKIALEVRRVATPVRNMSSLPLKSVDKNIICTIQSRITLQINYKQNTKKILEAPSIILNMSI